MPIVEAMKKCCPNAWLMNFTNPMSMLTTYLLKYTPIKNAGFCHQVHGSFGVIAEMLGYKPGEFYIITAGINHLNWLFDIRHKGCNESCMDEFLESVKKSKWWKENHKKVPQQKFSLEMLNTFNMYPVGYDDHIIEYFSCFWNHSEWEKHDYHSQAVELQESLDKRGEKTSTEIRAQTLQGIGPEAERPPFPRDENHPYYHEDTCQMIKSLETGQMTYFDANVGFNHGAVGNLPYDAIIDRPVVVRNGQVRSIHVGNLPIGPAEVCRRQIAIHEMVVEGTVKGDESLIVQALCLDPYVTSVTQAKAIWNDYFNEYKKYLTTF
jgi:alpha-galactosidase